MKLASTTEKSSVTPEGNRPPKTGSTIGAEANLKEDPEMKEATAIVTLMTGDVLHAEYLHGDPEHIDEKIHSLEKGHEILSVSVKDGDSFKRIYDAYEKESTKHTR